MSLLIRRITPAAVPDYANRSTFPDRIERPGMHANEQMAFVGPLEPIVPYDPSSANFLPEFPAVVRRALLHASQQLAYAAPATLIAASVVLGWQTEGSTLVQRATSHLASEVVEPIRERTSPLASEEHQLPPTRAKLPVSEQPSFAAPTTLERTSPLASEEHQLPPTRARLPTSEQPSFAGPVAPERTSPLASEEHQLPPTRAKLPVSEQPSFAAPAVLERTSPLASEEHQLPPRRPTYPQHPFFASPIDAPVVTPTFFEGSFPDRLRAPAAARSESFAIGQVPPSPFTIDWFAEFPSRVERARGGRSESLASIVPPIEPIPPEPPTPTPGGGGVVYIRSGGRGGWGTPIEEEFDRLLLYELSYETEEERERRHRRVGLPDTLEEIADATRTYGEEGLFGAEHAGQRTVADVLAGVGADAPPEPSSAPPAKRGGGGEFLLLLGLGAVFLGLVSHRREVADELVLDELGPEPAEKRRRRRKERLLEETVPTDPSTREELELQLELQEQLASLYRQVEIPPPVSYEEVEALPEVADPHVRRPKKRFKKAPAPPPAPLTTPAEPTKSAEPSAEPTKPKRGRGRVKR